MQDSVVEIGVIAESGACFATVVRPPCIPNEPECSNSVHGIPAAELEAGPDFATSFVRMVALEAAAREGQLRAYSLRSR